MLFLLGISTAIAIVVPEPRQDDPQEESTSGTTGATGSTGSSGSTGDGGPDGTDDQPGSSDPGPGPGNLVEATVKPDSKSSIVRVTPGERLVLTIFTEEPAVVEIADLGLTQTTSRYAPAVFDVIVPDEPKAIEVTTTGGDEPVATVQTGA